MSMPPELAAKTRYFVVRVRTHEWAEHQRVSLLDVPGLDRAHLRMLYAEEFSTADRIMTTPPAELVHRLSVHENFTKDANQALELVRGWQSSLVHLWQERVDAPLPDDWITDPTRR